MSSSDWIQQRPLIGMVHLLPLPGAPRSAGWQVVRDRAMQDAETLLAAGFDALMIENFGDAPFFPNRVPVETVSYMTAMTVELRQQFGEPLFGINVLRNDGLSAVAVAAATGAQFIRVNILCGARLTDQGIISGMAHDLLRLRARLDVEVAILADVDVKHSQPLAPLSVADEVEDLVRRGGADALIVSGSATGKPCSLEQLQDVQSHCQVPVLVGSGVTEDNLSSLAPLADGLIVGSSLKESQDPGSPVDAERAARFAEAYRRNISR